MINFDKELDIIYTVDDGFLPLVSTSLASIIENNRDKNINVFVATDKDETTENFSKLVNHHSCNGVQISYIDAKKYDSVFKEKNMNKWGSNSYYTYWRLVVPKLINVDYAVFVDADVLCLKTIESIDLSGKACGCVIDSVHSYYNKLMKTDKNFCFFNSGIIFFDIKKWKSEHLTEKCIDYIKNVKSDFFMADQDLLSLALRDEIKVISPKYNWFAGYDYYGIYESILLYSLNKKRFYKESDLESASKDIVFYHCLDGVFKRPWSIDNNHPAKEKYDYYKKKSAWPNYEKKEELPVVMKAEKILERVLPFKLYYKIHNFSIILMIRIKTLHL